MEQELSNQPIINKPLKFGFMVLAIFIGTFGVWACFTTLESGAVAVGVVTVDSNRKTIQHLEGGIINQIYVREGTKVKKDDVLVDLADTQATSTLELFRDQANSLLALQARLQAERDKLDNIRFPQQLTDQLDNIKVQETLESERSIFIAGRQAREGQQKILDQRVAQLNDEIESLDSQKKSQEEQLALLQEEIVAVAYLEKQKLIEKPRLLALKREASRLEGNRGEKLALIAQAKQKIGETQAQKIQLEEQYQSTVLEKLGETQTSLLGILERKKAAEDVLQRINIRAPQSGTVVNMQIHTRGGVISPGQALMDIVPDQDELVIEASINPLDIDVVHSGLEARVQLTAFKSRYTPQLNGIVSQVSADSLINKKTGEPYYLARIVISPEELSRLHKLELYPGMPAQVMIISSVRTPLEYLFSPIRDSFYKAFREE